MRVIAHGASCILALLLLLNGCAAARTLHGKCSSKLTNPSCDLACQRRSARINEFGLRPPGDTTECFTLFAKGTQTYECTSGDGIWTARNPRADLFASPDRKGKKVASQSGDSSGGRMTWSSSEENASVTTVRATSNVRSSFPSPDNREKNLAWRSTVRAGGVDGTAFGKVVGVVMADTSGGVAPPSSECNAAGKTVDVPYEAAYVFFE